MTCNLTRLCRAHRGLGRRCAVAALALSLAPLAASAQDASGRNQNPVKVFHLVNVAQQSEANEIMVAIRNMVAPTDKVYLLSQTNDVVVSAPPDQLALIGQLISELDRPKQTFRVTYTVSELDGGKRIGVQHFAMVVVTGQRVNLKQGDKIPLTTGSFGKDSASQETQVTYVDVGMNFDTTLDQFAGGLRLRSKVERSSVAEPPGGAMGQDPMIRQTVLEGTSVITPGKPLTLGSIDVEGTTRHMDIEVVAEPLS